MAGLRSTAKRLLRRTKAPLRRRILFLELFAGSGGLTKAVKAAGLRTLTADEASTGGTNFLNAADVERLNDALRRRVRISKRRGRVPHLRKSRNWQLVVHLAPPCSTFSRARDRSHRTRVRSMRQPSGIRPVSRNIIQANTVARRAAEFAVWAEQ